ncbi:MAG: NUDIX domain-containing protein [Candidatus Gracilibacteria bacterium]
MDIFEKRVAGGIIINNKKEIFLAESPKWNAWVVPGGTVEEGETDEDGFTREIQEELNITVKIIEKLGEKVKEPSTDFHRSNARFHFIDYLAYASDEEIKNLNTNDEISNYKWFPLDQIFEVTIVDTTKALIERSISKITALDLKKI